MSEQAVVYSVRHQRNEIQRQRERLRALVEKANGGCSPMNSRARVREVVITFKGEPVTELVAEYRGATYVNSRSEPGIWHRATYDECDCALAVYGRKYCRHQMAVSAMNKARAEEKRAA